MGNSSNSRGSGPLLKRSCNEQTGERQQLIHSTYGESNIRGKRKRSEPSCGRDSSIVHAKQNRNQAAPPLKSAAQSLTFGGASQANDSNDWAWPRILKFLISCSSCVSSQSIAKRNSATPFRRGRLNRVSKRELGNSGWLIPKIPDPEYPKRPIHEAHTKPAPCSACSFPVELSVRRDPRPNGRAKSGKRSGCRGVSERASSEYASSQRVSPEYASSQRVSPERASPELSGAPTDGSGDAVIHGQNGLGNRSEFALQCGTIL